MSANEDEIPKEAEGEESNSQDDIGTTHTDYRWKGLSTVLALFIGLGFPSFAALHSVGVVNISTIPQWAWLPITSGWGGVLVYVFGEDIRKTWKGER